MGWRPRRDAGATSEDQIMSSERPGTAARRRCDRQASGYRCCIIGGAGAALCTVAACARVELTQVRRRLREPSSWRLSEPLSRRRRERATGLLVRDEVAGRSVVARLAPGDMLVFDGDVAHAGASYCMSNLRLHTYLDVPEVGRPRDYTWRPRK